MSDRITEEQVPVITRQGEPEKIIPATPERQHVELRWADGPSGWVLVNVGFDSCQVVVDDYGTGDYRDLYGPFSFGEVFAGLVAISHGGIAEFDQDDWDDLVEAGMEFTDVSHGQPRVMVRTGEDEVTIYAPCGDEYTFTLSKLHAAVRRVHSLNPVTVT